MNGTVLAQRSALPLMGSRSPDLLALHKTADACKWMRDVACSELIGSTWCRQQ